MKREAGQVSDLKTSRLIGWNLKISGQWYLFLVFWLSVQRKPSKGCPLCFHLLKGTSWTLRLPIKMGYHQPYFWGSNPFFSWNFEGPGCCISPGVKGNVSLLDEASGGLFRGCWASSAVKMLAAQAVQRTKLTRRASNGPVCMRQACPSYSKVN